MPRRPRSAGATPAAGITDMKVAISVAGQIVWSVENHNGCRSGTTSVDYLSDGTQQKIIDALVRALAEARGQLGRPALQVVDAVPDVRPAPAEVNNDVPFAAVGHTDTSG